MRSKPDGRRGAHKGIDASRTRRVVYSLSERGADGAIAPPRLPAVLPITSGSSSRPPPLRPLRAGKESFLTPKTRRYGVRPLLPSQGRF